MVKLSCEAPVCGRPSLAALNAPSAYIIGGDLATEGEWPWAGSLMYRGEYRCAAVLIDAQWALTAAHCFVWSNGNSLVHLTHYFHLQFGSIYLRGRQDHLLKAKISKIIPFPSYTESSSGFRYQDVALIQLEDALEYNDYVRPACLPESGQDFAVTSICYTTGWGFTSTAESELLA